MSDIDMKKTSFSQNKKTGSSQDLKDQVADAGAELKQRAGDALQASTDAAQDKLKEAANAAKEVASGAADRVQEQVHEQQRSGADFVERFATNIRDAARAFESDAPFAARGINSAAEYVEDAAEKIRNGSFRDLVDGATDFAKRQPAAFLGISVLAGFAAIRFLKASGGQPSPSPKTTIGIRRRPRTTAISHEHPERYQNQPKRSTDHIDFAGRRAFTIRKTVSERDRSRQSRTRRESAAGRRRVRLLRRWRNAGDTCAGYGAVRTFGGIDGGGMVPAVILPYLCDCGCGDCRRSICDWH